MDQDVRERDGPHVGGSLSGSISRRLHRVERVTRHVWREFDRGQVFWIGGRESGRRLQSGTQRQIRCTSHLRQRSSAATRVLPARERHESFHRSHDGETVEQRRRRGHVLPLHVVDVSQPERQFRRRDPTIQDAIGPGVLRRGGIEPGGESETRSVARTHAERFGRTATIRGTLALPVVGREK